MDYKKIWSTNATFVLFNSGVRKFNDRTYFRATYLDGKNSSFQLSWVLILNAKNVHTLYVARFLNGLDGGANSVVTPLYLSEVASARYLINKH